MSDTTLAVNFDCAAALEDSAKQRPTISEWFLDLKNTIRGDQPDRQTQKQERKDKRERAKARRRGENYPDSVTIIR